MSWWTRAKDDQRGISAVLITVSLLAIFGAAMLSVDAGQLWSARRNVVTGTDAAALAQAQYFAQQALSGKAVPTTSCTSGVWDTALDKNVADTFDSSCSVVTVTGGSGYVVVRSRKHSPARFGAVLGIGDSAAFSLSAARWGATIPNGLRPIALCIADPHIADAIAPTETHKSGGAVIPVGIDADDYLAPDNSADMAGRTPGVVHHVTFNSSCNGNAGNFGWIDLDQYESGGQNFQNKDLADWLMNGYTGNHVQVPADCDYEVSGFQGCNGRTGVVSDSKINDALNYLMDPNGDGVKNPLTILIILYDTGTLTGSNANFHMVRLAGVKIWGYNLPNNNNESRYLDLEFENTITDGICCSDIVPGSGQPIGLKICDVDHDVLDPLLIAARCTSS